MAHAHDRTYLASLSFADPDKKDPLHDLACQYIARPEIFNSIGLESDEDLDLVLESSLFEQPISKGEGPYKTTIGFLDVIVNSQYVYDLWETQKCVNKLKFNTVSEAKTYLQAMNSNEEPKHIKSVTQKDLDELKNNNTNYEKRLKEITNEIKNIYANENSDRDVSGILYRRGLTMSRESDINWINGEIFKNDKIISNGIQQEECIVSEYQIIYVGRRRSGIYKIYVEVKINPIHIGDLLRQINLYREYLGCHAFDRYQGYHLVGREPPFAWVVAAAFDMSDAYVNSLREHNIIPVQLGENFRKWAADQQALPPATNVISI